MIHPAVAAGVPQVSELRCEYLVDPLGIGETRPRLSWIMESDRRGDRQTAYQILVAASRDLLAKDQGDLWDSGKIESDESAHVVYAGKPLTSRQACFWKVRVWSPLDDSPSPWSEPAMWTMGLLSPSDWQARWIDSSDAIKADRAISSFKLLHATYGTTQNTISKDVTDMLRGMIKNGQLSVTVNNESLGSDPAKDQKKQLNVEYEINGKITKETIAEHKIFSLPPESSRVYYLGKLFFAKNPIQHATLYVTALGLYDIHINGQRVGDHVLAPDWTDYNKRVRYQAYDVTPLVKQGGNAMAAMLANGWYAGHIGNGGFHQYGKTPALLAQLEITYADGSVEKFATDASWQTAPSPILSTDFMLGESYDARREINWDQLPQMNDHQPQWTKATVRDEPARSLDPQVSPPVRQTGTIKPIALTEPVPGHWTFDLGQNMVGMVRLKVSAPAGTVITIHHAEMLKPDGTVYLANLRRAPSVDSYICKGVGEEIWQPTFTFHGFRYVELTGLIEKPKLDTITGIVLGSDTPRTGSFSCSDPRINQLMSNIQWGQRGNYLSVPTDCPQRDERLGWMGDAQVFVRTATCNADVQAFFTKWLVDVDDAQRPDGAFTDVSPERGTGNGTPAWADAGVICPWTIYLAYGDKQLLQRNLPAMIKWVDWCKTHSTDLIRERKDRGSDYGDWLSIHANTPKEVIGTAYFAYSTHIVAQACKAVGDLDQAAKYQQLFEDIKAAFNKKYVDPDGRILGNTQCCYAMALKFDLLPESLRAKAAQYLVDDIKARDWHLSTGFVGVSYLLPTLAQTGHADVAYQLLMQDTFPSWLFSVKQGATTIWERWDGWTPEKGFQDAGMNSFNHYSLGSCGEWLYDSVAGIGWDQDQPGYKHIILRPVPGGGLTWAKATLGSPYGNISSDWKITGGKMAWNVTVPPNTTATVYIPAADGATITESDKPIEQADGVKITAKNVCELQSGSYAFVVK